MKIIKLALIVSVLCLFSAFGIGQTVLSNETEQENWQTYTPVKEEFSVEIPVKMSVSYYSIDPLKQSGSFQAVLNGNYYFILSENLQTSEQFDRFSFGKFSTANLYIEESVSKYNIAAKSVRINNFNGKLYKFADDEGFYQKILVIPVKNRTYIFHAFSETENDAGVKRFFDSLKLFENEELTNAKNNQPVEPTVKVPKAGTTGSGLGSGSGSGSGTGNETKLPAPTPTPTLNINTTNTFRITSQPRSQYTDKARIYNVSGVVRLRVTFLANGTIGAIKVIKRLPLGLTNSAIKAAQAIQFEPGTVPISKIVEYRFTLY